MSSLPELQSAFAAALRGQPDGIEREIAAGNGIDSVARLGVYRHNARAVFETALERSFPVLRRRVGEDYFRQLAHGYRERHPSNSGDLHWIGRRFADYLAEVEADTGYVWLADLAGLEWACETALVAAQEPAVGVDALADLAPEELAETRLRLQPSLSCVASAYPIHDVWCANQPGEDGRPVDLGRGGQCVLVCCGESGLELREVDAATFGFVRLLQLGEPLAEAVDRSRLAVEALPAALGLLFSAGLVAAVSRR